MRVACIGTYDSGKPRTRILLSALLSSDIEVDFIHVHVWEGIEDKSGLASTSARIKRGCRFLSAYPGIIWNLLRRPRYDVLFIPYLGIFDVVVLWPFARLRNTPIVWDAFLSLWDTVVRDRKLLRESQWRARALRFLEKVACLAANRILLDTASHAKLFTELYNISSDKLAAIPVGAEPEAFPPLPPVQIREDAPLRVLFYGQFIPLHGINTIIDAAILSREKAIEWILIGTGQESPEIRKRIQSAGDLRLSWKPWVDYKALSGELKKADIGLGIFGVSDKASRVIPNKVFQILQSHRPLITRDSAAIRELADENTPGIRLIPPGDAEALVDAILNPRPGDRSPPSPLVLSAFSPDFIRSRLVSELEAVVEEKLDKQ